MVISVSVTPSVGLRNPDVTDLTSTPRSTQGKLSFRCMTAGDRSLRFSSLSCI